MSKDAVSCYLTNMTMVRRGDEVLVLERIKNWPGITFPGGHVEKEESMIESAKREIFEETGLTLNSIRLKGMIDWYNTVNGERFFVYCFISDDFQGELRSETEEGRVYFMKISDLDNANLCPGFKEQLPIFLDDYSEYFGSYGDGKDHPKLLE